MSAARMPEGVWRHVEAQYAAGVATHRIAEVHRISQATVDYIVRKAGVARRSRGGQSRRTAVAVPAWVPAELVAYYVAVAAEFGEEDAASSVRRLVAAGESVILSRVPEASGTRVAGGRSPPLPPSGALRHAADGARAPFAEEALAAIPPDTRSLTQRLLGDPIPGDFRRRQS